MLKTYCCRTKLYHQARRKTLSEEPTGITVTIMAVC